MNVPSVKSIAGIGSATVVLFASVRPAAADEPNAALAWGLTAGELATAGVFVLNFGSDVLPSHGPGMIVNFTPLLVGPAIAYGAHEGGFDAAPALSVHGGGWLGLDLFMIGALVDGRDSPFGLRVGKTAWTLGAIGAIGGGLIGATAVDGKDESIAWLAAPPAGFTVGLLLIGGAIGFAARPRIGAVQLVRTIRRCLPGRRPRVAARLAAAPTGSRGRCRRFRGRRDRSRRQGRA